MAWIALGNLAHMSGHSSTFVADDLTGCEDVNSWDCDESMWWNNGIEIKGDSPARLGFYHEYVVENVPNFNEMATKEIEDKRVFRLGSDDDKSVENAKKHDREYSSICVFRYFLFVWNNSNRKVTLELSLIGTYSFRKIDWWGMKYEELDEVDGFSTFQFAPPGDAGRYVYELKYNE